MNGTSNIILGILDIKVMANAVLHDVEASFLSAVEAFKKNVFNHRNHCSDQERHCVGVNLLAETN